jgi:hypothetical protein
MDIYDREIARLTASPEAIGRSWNNYEPLFGCVSPSRNGGAACLTQIRGDSYTWVPDEALALRAEIALDERLPANENDITVEHLPIFAEWQRRIDKELGRAVPTI